MYKDRDITRTLLAHITQYIRFPMIILENDSIIHVSYRKTDALIMIKESTADMEEKKNDTDDDEGSISDALPLKFAAFNSLRVLRTCLSSLLNVPQNVFF